MVCLKETKTYPLMGLSNPVSLMGFPGTWESGTGKPPFKWVTLLFLAILQIGVTETQGNPPIVVNICSFIQRLNLHNSTVTQVITTIWHNARPRKVGTFIWLTSNRGLLVGTWLQCMGILPTCKVCTEEAPESPQHCLFECPLAKRAWEAFYHIWQEWERPMTSLFPGHSSCWVKLSSREKMTPPGSRGTM